MSTVRVGSGGRRGRHVEAVGHGGHRSFIGRSEAHTKRFPIQGPRQDHRRSPSLRTILVRVFVLGIDPGLTRCGYCVLDAPDPGVRGTARALALGVITTPADSEVHLRLAELQRELADLIAEFRPSVLAVERVLFQVNVRTAMSVGQASGIAMVEAVTAGCEVVAVLPERGEVGRRRMGRRRQGSRCSRWSRPCSACHGRPTRPTRPTLRAGAVPRGDGADARGRPAGDARRLRGCPRPGVRA